MQVTDEFFLISIWANNWTKMHFLCKGATDKLEKSI